MAEGDSIHRLARRLHAQLTSKSVVTSDFRISRYASTNLNGYLVHEVVAVGKHLLMRFTRASQSLTLHSHLRMSGSWTILAPGKSARHRIEDDDVRVLITFDDGWRLIATGTPVIDLVPTENEHEVVGHIGPDILGDNFELAPAATRLQTDIDRPIIQAMLDQRNVAGMGNLWVVETCFLRGMYPWQPAISVDAVALLRLARKMMLYSLNVKSGMVTTGNTRKGETHWVYGRYRRPCRRCTTPIAFRDGGSNDYDRETWWCPSCQPTPST